MAETKRKIYSEKYLERRLKERAKKRGAWALKFVSPGVNGAPDRIVIAADGRVLFAEIKTTGRKRTPIQEAFARELARFGISVALIDDLDTLNAFVESL